jgi:hypothetical protein
MCQSGLDKVESRGRARGKVGACNQLLRMLQMPKGRCFQSCLFQTRFPVKFPHCTVGVLSIEVGGKARFAPQNNHFHEQLSRDLRSLAPQRPAPFFWLLEDYVCQVAGVSSCCVHTGSLSCQAPTSHVRLDPPAPGRPGHPSASRRRRPSGDSCHWRPGVIPSGRRRRGSCSVLVTSTLASLRLRLACAHGACVTHEL